MIKCFSTFSFWHNKNQNRYYFNYNNFNNITNTKVNNQDLITNNYEPNNGNLLSSTYGNNDLVSFTYDNFNRLSTKVKEDNTYTYLYDNSNNLAVKKDNNNTCKYTYDLASRLTEYIQNNNYKINYKYDNRNNVNNVDYSLNDIVNTSTYSYDNDSKQMSYTVNNNRVIYDYDLFSRLSNKKINNFITTYEYLDLEDNKTTTLLDKITNNNQKIRYVYDELGNIKEIYINEVLENVYEYDGLNQLILEKTYSLNKKIEYTYDLGGNILTKVYKNLETDAIINTYSYSYDSVWKDKLISFNGESFTYDIIGIIDIEGNQLVSYEYDSWGQILSIKDNQGNEITDQTNIGNINPFRYRSYYYDSETELYYLNSRYYNPELGRFINIDALLESGHELIGNNLYAYVSNNPVNMADPSGKIGIILGCAIIGAAASFFSGIVYGSAKSYSETGKVNVLTVLKYATLGGIGGAGLGAFVGTLGYGVTLLLNPQVKDSAQQVKDTIQQGYDTFKELKHVLPKTNVGNEIHHIVEQSQIIKSSFDPKVIHNVNNVVEISKSVHGKISGYYSSNILPGIRVRDWLTGQSFQTQYEFGIKVIEMFKEF